MCQISLKSEGVENILVFLVDIMWMDPFAIYLVCKTWLPVAVVNLSKHAL